MHQNIPVDEIELTEIESDTNLFKIVGEYKNSKSKPWAIVEPEKESKTMWELIKADNKTKEIEEIGEGSSCFEHHFEFW